MVLITEMPPNRILEGSLSICIKGVQSPMAPRVPDEHHMGSAAGCSSGEIQSSHQPVSYSVIVTVHALRRKKDIAQAAIAHKPQPHLRQNSMLHLPE